MGEAAGPPRQRRPRFMYNQEQLNQIRDAMETYIRDHGKVNYQEVADILIHNSDPTKNVFRENDLDGRKVRNIWMNRFAPQFNRGPATEAEYIILGDAKRSGKHIVLTTILPNRTGQWVANVLTSDRFLDWYNKHNSELTPEVVQASTESVGRSGVAFSESHPSTAISQPVSQETFDKYLEGEGTFFGDDDTFNNDFVQLNPSFSDYPTLSASVERFYSDPPPFMPTSSSIPPPEVDTLWYNIYSSESVPRPSGGNRMKSFIKARKSSRKAHKKSSRKAHKKSSRKSSRKARKSSRK